MAEATSPIAIFVYKRVEHTRRLFESLAKCPEFPHSKIIIFSDGAKGKEDASNVGKVRNVISEYVSGTDCRVVLRPTNLGLAESIISGVTEVLGSHNSVVVLEDDLVVAQDFLKFMNWGLTAFQDDSKVFSITGFSFPAQYFSFPEGYRKNVYLSPRCSSWSWATWRDRWEKVDWNAQEIDEFLKDTNRRKRFAQIGWDLPRMLRLQRSGLIDSWAIRFCLAHFKNSAYCLHPASTLVHNQGLDRSGTHSWKDRRFEHHTDFLT